jgi:hypothetical protein
VEQLVEIADRVKVKGDPLSPEMTVIQLAQPAEGIIIAVCMYFVIVGEATQPVQLNVNVLALERAHPKSNLIQ